MVGLKHWAYSLALHKCPFYKSTPETISKLERRGEEHEYLKKIAAEAVLKKMNAEIITSIGVMLKEGRDVQEELMISYLPVEMKDRCFEFDISNGIVRGSIDAFLIVQEKASSNVRRGIVIEIKSYPTSKLKVGDYIQTLAYVSFLRELFRNKHECRRAPEGLRNITVCCIEYSEGRLCAEVKGQVSLELLEKQIEVRGYLVSFRAKKIDDLLELNTSSFDIDSILPYIFPSRSSSKLVVSSDCLSCESLENRSCPVFKHR